MTTLRNLFESSRIKFLEFFRAPIKPPSVFRKQFLLPSRSIKPMETIDEEKTCYHVRQRPHSVTLKRTAITNGNGSNPTDTTSSKVPVKASPRFVVHEDESPKEPPKESPKELPEEPQGEGSPKKDSKDQPKQNLEGLTKNVALTAAPRIRRKSEKSSTKKVLIGSKELSDENVNNSISKSS